MQADNGDPVDDIDLRDVATDALRHLPQEFKERVAVKAKESGQVVKAGSGVPGSPYRYRTVRGGKGWGASAVVDEFNGAVAVVDLEQVRLRVEPVDLG